MARERRYRLLLVTFDLTETVPGDARYNRADSAMKSYGNVFRPVKQLRLLITQATSKAIKGSLEQKLGRDVTIMVAPITSIPAWRIYGTSQRREWRRFVKALSEYNVAVKYVSSEFDHEL